jgi:hypothetical protein
VEFIKSCVTPHLIGFKVHAYPSILQSPSGRHRGGNVTVERLARFLSHEYHAADRLTTFVDFYGFSDTNGRSRHELEQAILERVIEVMTDCNTLFVRPYVQMHEFEALLFSDIDQFQFAGDGWSDGVRRQLTAVATQFPCPEDIDNHPKTAPSKRILGAFPKGTYSKTEHGPLIAEAIGLPSIRECCPQFDEWMLWLEALGGEVG